MKPTIGIISGIADSKSNHYNYHLSSSNVEAITEAGGLPLIIPYDINSIDDYLSIVDGIYFTGGGDINPIFLNEDPHKNIGSIWPDRDMFEIELCKKAFIHQVPIIGVCRGAQIINIVAGGTIYQDLNSQTDYHICHKQLSPTPLSAYFHLVNLKKNTVLYDIYNTNKIYTNSYHHQSIKDPAPNFIVSARTSDGIVEAIEYVDNNFILGIQWHPEILKSMHKDALLIYERFIKECTIRIKNHNKSDM